jgi:hypothetical protein
VKSAIRKGYKKKDSDEWDTTTSYRRDELPVVQHVADQAYVFILQQESSRNDSAEE